MTHVEAAKALPGDDLVPTPTAIDTRGITIEAPPEAVWPWLVQMGFDRGGWYSYDRMDMRGMSAEHLITGMPELKVGDVIPTGPDSGFEVRVLEPGKALTLYLDTKIVAKQAEAAAARADSSRHPRRARGVERDPAHSACGLRGRLDIRPRAARRWPDQAPRARPRPIRR